MATNQLSMRENPAMDPKCSEDVDSMPNRIFEVISNKVDR